MFLLFFNLFLIIYSNNVASDFELYIFKQKYLIVYVIDLMGLKSFNSIFFVINMIHVVYEYKLVEPLHIMLFDQLKVKLSCLQTV